jgi:hypothetical protein
MRTFERYREIVANDDEKSVYVPNEEYPESWIFYNKQMIDKDALEILSKFQTVITVTVVIAGYMVNIKSHHDGPLVFWLADSLHASSPLLQRARPTLSYTTLPPTYNRMWTCSSIVYLERPRIAPGQAASAAAVVQSD